MSWKPEVKVDGKWAKNGLVFETEREAKASAKDLQRRWSLVQDARAVESDETVNYKFAEGVLERIKHGTTS